MTPYIVMLLIITICVIIETYSKKELTHRWALALALVPVFVLIAFKAETVGTDTANYVGYYNYIVKGDPEDMLVLSKTFETGYFYLNVGLTKISTEPQTLLICLGLIVCLSLYQFISLTAKNRSLALLFFVTLGFFQFAMSGIRQTIAISIVLWAYPYIRDRKLLKFAIVIFLAMQFHKSAIIFAPAYFIANMKLNSKNILLLTLGMGAVFFMSDILLTSAADMMDYKYGIERTGNGQIFFFIVLLITIACYMNRKDILARNPDNHILLNINFISLTLWLVRLVSRTAERVSFYFMPYTYVAFEEYITTRKNANRAVFIAAIIVLASILFLYRINGQTDLNNFKFFIK